MMDGRVADRIAILRPARTGTGIAAFHHGRVAHAGDGVVIAAVVGTGRKGIRAKARRESRCRYERECERYNTDLHESLSENSRESWLHDFGIMGPLTCK